MENEVQQEDEMAILEAMKTKENEFQWERLDNTIVGVIRVEPIVQESLNIQFDPDPGIYKHTSQLGSHNTISVTYLPQMELQFQLKSSYPSEAPPEFNLSCKWLNFSQLGMLCRSLDQIWSDNEGTVILYQWQQFLSSESLPALLGDKKVLTIKYQNPRAPQSDWDGRGIQEMSNLFEVIPFLVEHDRQQKVRAFQESRFPCEICFLTVSGSESVYLQPCCHVYCTECMKGHITNKITEGNVTKIECPNSDCTEILLPGLIQGLVSAELFDRYDKLLLQRTLDGMTDIFYCPRLTCGCVTVKEDDSNMGLCPRCKFSFCTLCKRTWHGISPCKLLPSDMKELKDMYESGDADIRRSLEQQYGREHLLRGFQEYDSNKWIKKNSKGCPNCQANIEKDHGCNKMTCMNCNCNFCWLCNAMLPRHNPYAHFHYGSSSCGGKLFEGEIPDFNGQD